jgi:hypothetical protein
MPKQNLYLAFQSARIGVAVDGVGGDVIGEASGACVHVFEQLARELHL